MIRFLIFLLLIPTVLAAEAVADWPQFRGPNGGGVANPGKVPLDFGPGENELWRTELGSGHSSPCIIGDRIFLTTFDREHNELALVCLARGNGEVLWKRTVPTTEIETGHPSFNPASSTPCGDASVVVAYFGSYGLVCFDHDGVQRWDFSLPLARSYAGNAISPVIVRDRVILYRGNHVGHFLLALNKVDGKELWKIPQSEPFTDELACTACPIVAGDKLIVHSARSVQAFQIEGGTQLWEAKCATTATSTPVLHGEQVLVAAWNKMGEPALRPQFPTYEQLLESSDRDHNGTISKDELPKLWIFHRPEGAEAPQNGATVRFGRVDTNQDGKIASQEWSQQMSRIDAFRAGYDNHGLLAINVESQGYVRKEEVQVLETNGIPEVPSPICYGDFVYMVKNGGVLTVLDLRTGKRTSRTRTGGHGTHYASPVIADEKLISVAGDGLVSVLSLGPKPKVLAKNVMGERVFSTPAVDQGVIYIRTHKALHAFGYEESQFGAKSSAGTDDGQP